VAHRPIVAAVGELDGWKHCPLCAAKLRYVDDRLECTACRFVHYAGSKPTASALVVDDDGRVMLSRRGIDPQAGMWDLPGGFVEEGEHPVDCLHRELREEAGIGLRDTRFIGIFMDRYRYAEREFWTMNAYWSARIADGTPEPADDVVELRFFAPDELPVEELAFEHLPHVISAWRRNKDP
jgi:NAD+ diphosphatase